MDTENPNTNPEPAAPPMAPGSVTPPVQPPVQSPVATPVATPPVQPVTIANPAPAVQPAPQPEVVVPAPVQSPELTTTPTPTVTPAPSLDTVPQAQPAVVSPPPTGSPAVVQTQTTGTPPQNTSKMGSFMGSMAGKKKLIFLVVGIALMLSIIAVAVYFALAASKANKDATALKADLAMATAKTHELPSSAQKVSECVPNMGYHYLFEGGTVEFGPFYLVNTRGEVIGLEFMYSNDMFTPIPGQEIPVEVIMAEGGLSLNQWQFDKMEISHLPQGHPSFERDHVDIHLYTVSQEEQARACE